MTVSKGMLTGEYGMAVSWRIWTVLSLCPLLLTPDLSLSLSCTRFFSLLDIALCCHINIGVVNVSWLRARIKYFSNCELENMFELLPPEREREREREIHAERDRDRDRDIDNIETQTLEPRFATESCNTTQPNL